jgi:excisionase family DNA binding protein
MPKSAPAQQVSFVNEHLFDRLSGMETLERGMTREEVVEITTFSLSKVDALIRSGELPAAKVGRRVVIQPRHVRELLEKNIREATVTEPSREARALVGLELIDAAEAVVARDWGRFDALALGPLHAAEAAVLFAVLARKSGQPQQYLAKLRRLVQQSGTD